MASLAGEKRMLDEQGHWPLDMRKFMGWIFLAGCPKYIIDSLRCLRLLPYQLRSLSLYKVCLSAPTFSLIAAFVCALAWWLIVKKRPSRRAWALAASATYLLSFFRQFIVPLPTELTRRVDLLFVGIVGAVVFIRSEKG